MPGPAQKLAALPGWSISPGPIGAGRNVLCVWCWAPQFPRLLGGGRSAPTRGWGASPDSQWSAQIWGNSGSCFSLLPVASQARGPLWLLGNLVTKNQEGPVCDDAEAAVPTVQLLGMRVPAGGNCARLPGPSCARAPWLDGWCLSADNDGSSRLCCRTPMLQSLLGYLAMELTSGAHAPRAGKGPLTPRESVPARVEGPGRASCGLAGTL